MNHTSSKKSPGGVSVRVVHIAMLLCAAAVAALLVFSLRQSSSVFTTLSNETGNYIVRQKAAHALMEASDYLTEMVQRFTLDGDTVYMDNYFEEAYTSRRREAAIVSMSENDADQTLVQHLQEALEESQALMYREYYAMRLVIEARNITDYPDTLKAIELKESDIFLSPEEKIDLAQKMVMGTEYYASKGVIRSRLKADLETLDTMMAATRQEATARSLQNLNRNRNLVIASMVLLVLLIWLTAKICTLPLLAAVRARRKNEPIPVIGAREFREMANGYNELQSSLSPEEAEEAEDGGEVE